MRNKLQITFLQYLEVFTLHYYPYNIITFKTGQAMG